MSTNDVAATVALNLTGNGFNNEIWGNAGANILDGGGGADDALIGLGGDDIYRVDVASTRIFESAGGGIDTVLASISYTLGDVQEIERLSTVNDAATTAINLTGNLLGNELRGNAGVNVLNGGGGEDVLIGLHGNDIYYVDSAADQVLETFVEGIRDVVYTSISYALSDVDSDRNGYVEVLATNSYAATTPIDLTGNNLDNELWGNDGVNVLNGGFGSDVLVGLGGDDHLIGGLGNDRLEGGDGNDILDGLIHGSHSLYGGQGDDTYYVRDNNTGIYQI